MSEQYLDAGFDPQGLKMSAIRNILNKHSVEFPSNAKKSELLGILQHSVLDQASKLRKEAKKLKRVKADGRDIEVMPPGVSAIGERTRARTPKPVERTRPPLVKRETKDESAIKAPPATPVMKVAAAAARTIAKTPVTPMAKAPSASTARPPPVTPTARPPATTTLNKVPLRTSAKPVVATELDKNKKKTKKIRPVAREPVADSPPPKPTMDKATAAKVGTKRKLSDAEAEGGGGQAVDSGDEEMFTPAKARVNEAQRQRIAKYRQEAEAEASPSSNRPRKHVIATAAKKERPKGGNFSDENPFQSSPETARKRRRKATDATQQAAAVNDVGPVTPMGALRKSQVSDLSFRVALPRATPPVEAPPAPEAVDDGGMELDQHGGLEESDLAQAQVGDLVARFQQEPTVREEPPVGPPPKFSLAPRPLASVPSARFTMTPDALRQLASSANQLPPPPPPDHHRRATTNQINWQPLVAPRIAVAPRNPAGPPRIVAQAAADSDGDSDGALQRRRVATLRQHVEGSRAIGSHSRRSSVASAISESRGVPGIPSRAARDRVARNEPQFKRRQRRSGLRAVVSWVGVAMAALAAWRTHEQWSLGFGNARAELGFVAPAAGSALLMPEAPSGADVIEQARYWAQHARAAYLEPRPLSCPEHAECTVQVPLHAWRSAEPGPRDQWLVASANGRVAAVQCDAGYVIAFPPLAPRWIPRVPSCIRDASTELRVHALADALVAECEAHRGRVQCAGSAGEYVGALLRRLMGGGDPESPALVDEAEEIERLGVSVSELRRVVSADRSPLLGDEDFDVLFRLAVEELESQRGSQVEQFVVEDEENVEEAFFVAHRPRLPLLCRTRNVVLESLLGNLPAVVGSMGVAVVALFVSRRIAARRAERRAADVLVGSALRRLKRQARRHYLDPALSPSPAIPSLQLRDLLLLAGGGAGPGSLPDTPEGEASGRQATVYYDPRARAGVWDRVRAVVERSANVRCRTTAVRGEPMRVWEWIGPLDDEEEEEMFSAFGSPFGSPQRVLSSGPL
ncbi:inner nuclear membrane protein enriched at telomere/subtelomere region [Coemansia sp. RSA 2050]|nr:inner nuclear membrane protein enriched at telomere/subtelomere region [Coemansia sp. RSA 2050]KAJ2730839.1 inner nuclear membrane protein enriched at telomere/subtelomere region [Coemansia sp. BCRC 34962]